MTESASRNRATPAKRKRRAPGITPAQITQTRERLGLTMTAMAREIGCTKSALSMWESGDRSPTGVRLRSLRILAIRAGVIGQTGA